MEFGIFFKLYVTLQHHNAVKGKYFPHFMLPILLPRNIPDKTVKEHNVALHELFECVFLNIVSYSLLTEQLEWSNNTIRVNILI